MKNSSYKNILIVPALLVVGLCVFCYFVFSDIRNKNEHISLLQRDLALQTNKEQYLMSLQKTIQDSNSDITRLDNSIVPSDGDVHFIENIESLARDNGLEISIDSLGFDDALASSTTMTTLKVDGKTKGGWLGTYKFLAELESMPLKIKINQFGFQTTLEGNNPDSKVQATPTGIWQSSFEILILKYK